MTTELSEITPLILAGDGYQLTISAEAEQRKAELLSKAEAITTVTDNNESGRAQFQTRSLAAMRIEVEKSRKLIKEPVNRIGKMIDNAAAEFLAEIVAEENRIKKLVGDHADEVMRIKAEKEAAERAAFDAARAAREAAEEGGIAAVIAAKKLTAEKLQASNEVAATKLASGIRYAWDFEVDNIEAVFKDAPQFCTLEIKRSAVLAWLKEIEEGRSEKEVIKAAESIGIAAAKKPIVSSR